jgi:hypothetical protein
MEQFNNSPSRQSIDGTRHHDVVALERLQKFAIQHNLLDKPVLRNLEKPRVGCRDRLILWFYKSPSNAWDAWRRRTKQSTREKKERAFALTVNERERRDRHQPEEARNRADHSRPSSNAWAMPEKPRGVWGRAPSDIRRR